jgi:mannose-1-phosphate guanylyltransferase
MRRLTGIDLPKQYCTVIGSRSMLQHTWDRVATLILRRHIVTVITRHHLDQAWAQLKEWPTEQLLIQPSNRETAPGLLFPLLAIRARDPGATVAIFPSDHFILQESVFMDHVEQAVHFLADCPSLVLLLGIPPDRPESGYGWIQPGEELARRKGFGLFQVRRFSEKPDPSMGDQFFLQGGLWNSLVLIGRLDTFLRHVEQVLPELWASFQAVASALGTVIEARILEEVYGAIPAMNLSTHLLQHIPHHLGVVPVKGVTWCDWGDETRIFETLTRIGKADEVMARLGKTARPHSREAA